MTVSKVILKQKGFGKCTCSLFRFKCRKISNTIDLLEKCILRSDRHWSWQRPPTTRPTTFYVWKTRGYQGSFRLLMMGGVSPETCWASYKYGIIKKMIRCCILFGFFFVNCLVCLSIKNRQQRWVQALELCVIMPRPSVRKVFFFFACKLMCSYEHGVPEFICTYIYRFSQNVRWVTILTKWQGLVHEKQTALETAVTKQLHKLNFDIRFDLHEEGKRLWHLGRKHSCLFSTESTN